MTQRKQKDRSHMYRQDDTPLYVGTYAGITYVPAAQVNLSDHERSYVKKREEISRMRASVNQLSKQSATTTGGLLWNIHNYNTMKRSYRKKMSKDELAQLRLTIREMRAWAEQCQNDLVAAKRGLVSCTNDAEQTLRWILHENKILPKNYKSEQQYVSAVRTYLSRIWELYR